MMDRIMAMRTFVRIVDTNSFTRAASSLGIPRASATTLLQSLEELLGIQLLVRTTRRLNLTAEGAAYYERCVQILADIDDIEASLQHTDDRRRGRLRVELPAAVANATCFPHSMTSTRATSISRLRSASATGRSTWSVTRSIAASCLAHCRMQGYRVCRSAGLARWSM